MRVLVVFRAWWGFCYFQESKSQLTSYFHRRPSRPLGGVIRHPGLWRAKHTRQFGPQMLTCCKTEFSEKLCKWKKYWKNLDRPGLGGNQSSCCEHAFLKRYIYICTVYIYSFHVTEFSKYLSTYIHLPNKTYCMSLHIYPSKNPEVSVNMPNMDGMGMPNMDAMGMEHLPSTFISFKKHIWRFPMLKIHDQQELQSSSGP